MKEFNIGDIYLNKNNASSIFYIVLDKSNKGLEYAILSLSDYTTSIKISIYFCSSSEYFSALVCPYNYIGNIEYDATLFGERVEIIINTLYKFKNNYEKYNSEFKKFIDTIKEYTDDRKKIFRDTVDDIIGVDNKDNIKSFDTRKSLQKDINKGIKKKIDSKASNYRFRNNLHNIIN